MNRLMPLLLCLLAVSLHAADGPPAARVNGVEISQMRLERYFAEYLEDQGRALTSIRNPSVYKRLREQALNDLIDRELLWQEAQRQGVAVSDAEVEARIGHLRQAFGSNEVFERRLADAGFDPQSFAAYTRQEMAAQQVFVAASRVPEPSAAQVSAFYQANAKSFAGGQNQSQGDPVQREQGLAMAKTLLIDQLQTQARQALLQRLRDSGQLQRID
ncbi:SurA N-terminal domain-containing protein [Pseudomonas sp. B21-032]|uniref:SurA N-terminal domain-containing protein n=1 Tax=Pseudomonas sp. B21-032 TaxID=2895483 RepID=UPI00215DF9FE|nr:SurA N-terminal domain-containing protein [Pseudomonas sp. B21-032]UVL59306.1 SurA N-terminal domain-containing protein [Pseudomonas sp. B21-032]